MKKNPLVKSTSQGIESPFWVWASSVPAIGIPRKQPANDSPNSKAVVVTDEAAATQIEINQLLADNSSMSGATLLNLLKAQGFSVVKDSLLGASPAPNSEVEEVGPGSGPQKGGGSSDTEKALNRAVDTADKHGGKNPKAELNVKKKSDAHVSALDKKADDIRSKISKAKDDYKKGSPKVDALAKSHSDIKSKLQKMKDDYKRDFGKEYKSGKEADAASSNAASVRSGVNEALTKESEVPTLNFLSHFVESAASDNGIGPTKFSCVLLQEGLGNLKDGYFYTKDALKSAISIFEGKKVYADHPTSVDEQVRPERSVKDVLGHFENVRYHETDDGTGQLLADVVTLPDKPYEWARALMRHAVSFGQKYPDKEFVGLSINAQGEAAPIGVDEFTKSYPQTESSQIKMSKAIEGGLTEVKIVKSITGAISCDLVTEAGAGGKIMNILESENGSNLIEKKKAISEGGPGIGRRPGGGKKEKLSKAALAQKSLNDFDKLVKAKGMSINDKAVAANRKIQVDNLKKAVRDQEKTAKKYSPKESTSIWNTLTTTNGINFVLKESNNSGKECKMQNKKQEAVEGAPEHKDEAQDAALIKQMLDKYIGEEEHSEETMMQAKEAYEAACSEGMEAEEAMMCAGQGLKMARIMKKKQEAAAPEGEEEVSEEPAQEAIAEASVTKESEELIKVKAENAALKEKFAKIELEKYIDGKLAESKQSRETTKKFLEAAGDIKSQKDFDTKFKVWVTAKEAVSGEVDASLWSMPEKTIAPSGGEALNFADCVK